MGIQNQPIYNDRCTITLHYDCSKDAVTVNIAHYLNGRYVSSNTTEMSGRTAEHHLAHLVQDDVSAWLMAARENNVSPPLPMD
jgi:Zn-dependent membrane protease YugP